MCRCCSCATIRGVRLTRRLQLAAHESRSTAAPTTTHMGMCSLCATQWLPTAASLACRCIMCADLCRNLRRPVAVVARHPTAWPHCRLLMWLSCVTAADVMYCTPLWHAQVVRRPVVVAGNSIGGFISASMAGDYPSLVEGLMLLNSAGQCAVWCLLAW